MLHSPENSGVVILSKKGGFASLSDKKRKKRRDIPHVKEVWGKRKTRPTLLRVEFYLSKGGKRRALPLLRGKRKMSFILYRKRSSGPSSYPARDDPT